MKKIPKPHSLLTLSVLSILLLLSSMTLIAQNVVINTDSPDPSSELDIVSNKKGLLIPRLPLISRDKIDHPATGLLIFQTDNEPGFYYYDGSRWQPMNNPEALLRPGATQITYGNTSHFEKPVIFNSTSLNYTKSVFAPESKLSFYPAKWGAFRAGVVNNSDWNTDKTGLASVALGFGGVASGDYSFVAGNGNNATQNSSISMGGSNSSSYFYSIAMGYLNKSSGTASVAMGQGNNASASQSVALGNNNEASGASSLAAGANNQSTGDYSIALGSQSVASANSAVAIGGGKASGLLAFAIGPSTFASGNASFAIGSYVNTNNFDGSFILGDISGSSKPTNNTAHNQMMMRFSGGYVLYTNTNATLGVRLASGGNSWLTVSDSTKKENFLTAPDFLQKISQMKLGSWNYKAQDKTLRHYGPMAQEFYAQFG